MSNWRTKSRAVWDKYRCEWHISGNYSHNRAIIDSKHPSRMVLEKTVKLVKQDPPLWKLLKYRQDWIITVQGRTDLQSTKANVAKQLEKIKFEVEKFNLPTEWMDPFIENGFQELEPPKERKLRMGKRRQAKYNRLAKAIGV